MSDPVEDFIERFRWSADGRFGGWKLLDPVMPIGDCEDFALTVAWLLAGRSKLKLIWGILTFRYVFWFCLSAGTGSLHWVLWVRGHGWIDNIQPTWKKEAGHRRLFPLPVAPALYAVIA